ncbi:MAG TPA: hypothetical protein VM238_14670 [Phycisphaerae bacterium]|nr:hypothetical protein [Phycisphaerae bacterium]
MGGKYSEFDRDALDIRPMDERTSDMDLEDVLEVGERPIPFDHPNLPSLADAMAAARERGKSIVLLMGAHVIKQGLSRYVIDLVRRGWVSVVAMNGACAVHDYELARFGETTESVARYISEGQFGLWRETGELNDIIAAGRRDGLGFGEALGRHIAATDWPHRDVSIFATAYESGVPATVHVGIGYDIVHEHPNCDGAAIGAASYRDFLVLARVVEGLEGGVVLCCGSAVMGPEVYLKALAMARNVARQQGREICHFTAAVFDLAALTGDLKTEPPKDSPEYYFRPYKTVLVRTVRDGGTSYYIRGDHRATLPALHGLLVEQVGG